MVKVTFSLDEETVEQLRRTANRLGRAQSQVVREAVADYASRTDRLTERERLRLLGVLDRLQGMTPTRSGKSVDAELATIREARRTGGRQPAS
ncbi:MAG: ribbon-helix-helix protein, CopG family [Vicinamibacterales bacterium]